MAKVTFSSLDVALLVIVFASFLLLGLSTKLKSTNSLSLIAAGRKLTLPFFVATLVTTWYGGILGIGESFDWIGIATWLIFGVPYYLFGLAYAFFMARKVRDVEQISLPERFSRVNDRTTGVICALLILLIALPGFHIFMLATLIENILETSLFVSAVIGALVGTVYLYRGGLLADARANIVSFLLMYIGFLFALVYAITHLGSPSEVISSLPDSHRSWDGKQEGGIWFVISWYMIGAWTFVDPGFHQRVTSTNDSSLSFKGVLWSVFFWVIFDFLSIGTAMYAYASLGPGHGANLFPLFGEQVLPSGIKGLFFAGMLGVILSAMAGYTLVAGSTIGRDILARSFRIKDEQRVVLFTRIGIVVATVLAIALAMYIPSVVQIWFTTGGIVIPGLLFPTIFAFRKPLPPFTTKLCMLMGSGSALAWYLLIRYEYVADELSLILPIYVGLVGAIIALIIGAFKPKGVIADER
jgi:SSS family solute:Na+ symporter